MVHLNTLLFTHLIVLSFRTSFQNVHNTEFKLTDVLFPGLLCFPFFSGNTVFSVFHSWCEKFAYWPVLFGLGSFSCQFLTILGHSSSVCLCSSTLKLLKWVSTPVAIISVLIFSTHFQHESPSPDLCFSSVLLKIWVQVLR